MREGRQWQVVNRSMSSNLWLFRKETQWLHRPWWWRASSYSPGRNLIVLWAAESHSKFSSKWWWELIILFLRKERKALSHLNHQRVRSCRKVRAPPIRGFSKDLVKWGLIEMKKNYCKIMHRWYSQTKNKTKKILMLIHLKQGSQYSH